MTYGVALVACLVPIAGDVVLAKRSAASTSLAP